MALWEALCLLLAARTWLARQPLGATVRVKSDNLSALQMVAKGKAKSPNLSIVAREIALDQAKGVYEFTILQHLNTKLNKLADPLRRQFEPQPAPFPYEELKHARRVPIVVDGSFWHLPRDTKVGIVGLSTGRSLMVPSKRFYLRGVLSLNLSLG